MDAPEELVNAVMRWMAVSEHVGSHLKVNDDGQVAVRPKAAS